MDDPQSVRVVLHHQELDGVFPVGNRDPRGSYVVERTDVRMGECPDGVGLALEAGPPFRIGRELRLKSLDCHHSIEAAVPGPEDLAHSATAELRHDLVRAKARSRDQ